MRSSSPRFAIAALALAATIGLVSACTGATSAAKTPISGAPAPASVNAVPTPAANGTAPSIEAVVTPDGATLLIVARNVPAGTAVFTQDLCPAGTTDPNAILDNTITVLSEQNGVLVATQDLPVDDPAASPCSLTLLAVANGQTSVIASTTFTLPVGATPSN